MEKYIFISYAHKDSQTVVPILDELSRAGVPLWYDEGIEAGTEWPETIENKLVGCSAILVFLSPDSVASQNCRNEINLALSLKKEMLTVYLSETELRGGMSLQLGTIQALFKYRHPSHKSFMQSLLSSDIISSHLPDHEDTRYDRLNSPKQAKERARKKNPLDIIARAPRLATVTFGSYPRSTMHPEPIRWLVVKKTLGMALLITKDIIDCRDFGPDYDWKDSAMRAWLNGEFASAAFTPAELDAIESVKRTSFSIVGNQETEDKVFLFDIRDCRECFKWFGARFIKAKHTPFSKMRAGGLKNTWWLRSSFCKASNETPDFFSECLNVYRKSKILPQYVCFHRVVAGKEFDDVWRDKYTVSSLGHIGVRPAIWVRYI